MIFVPILIFVDLELRQCYLMLERSVAIKLNLKRVIAGGRLYNYCEYADKISPHEYAYKVVKGEIQDPVLSFDLKNGFKCIKIIPDYIHDSRSLNYATFIEWLNPKYHRMPIFTNK